jgi:hypothetical protein
MGQVTYRSRRGAIELRDGANGIVVGCRKEGKTVASRLKDGGIKLESVASIINGLMYACYPYMMNLNNS